MENLLSAWPALRQRVVRAEHVFLGLDFDGTLVPIGNWEDPIVLAESARRLLLELNRQRRYTVAILSARSLSDLRARVGLENLIYAGNLGLEIHGPGIEFIAPGVRRVRPLIARIADTLRRELGRFPEVFVEYKELSLTVHCRHVEESHLGGVFAIWEQVVGPHRDQGKVAVRERMPDLEVRPAVPWDKGTALSLIHGLVSRRTGFSLPIYIGDDEPDEVAFGVVNGGDGISSCVGAGRPGVARYYVDSPAEVELFLEFLASAARSQSFQATRSLTTGRGIL